MTTSVAASGGFSGTRFFRFIRLNPCFCAFLVVALYIGWAGPPARPRPALDLTRAVEVEGRVDSFPEWTADFVYFELTPTRVTQGGGTIPYEGRVAVYVYGQEAGREARLPRPGEMIRFVSLLREPNFYAVPGVSDFRGHLWYRGILHNVRLKSHRQMEFVGSEGRALNSILPYIRDFRGFLAERLEPDHERLLLSVFLGRKRALEGQDRERIRSLGIYHLFVVSGFHVSLVVGFLHVLLGRLGFAGRILSLAGLWFYVILAGAGLPTLRAGIMTSTFYLLWCFGLRSQLLNSLGVAGLLLLAVWPVALFDPGFQFSFLSLSAIGFFVVPASSPIFALEGAIRAAWSPRVSVARDPHSIFQRRVRYCIEDRLDTLRRIRFLPALVRIIGAVVAYCGHLVLTSVFIQLFTLALTLYYSNRWIWTQWLANLVLMPLFALFVPLCLLLFLTYRLPGVELAVFATRAASDLIDRAMRVLESISVTTFLPQPNVPLLLAYPCLVLLVLFAPQRWRWILFLIAPLLLWTALSVPTPVPSQNLVITMLDVGQGESIHLRYPDGTQALIDTGGISSEADGLENFIGERVVSRYLWWERCRRLEYILVTHPHADHIQGLGFIRKAFPIGILRYFRFDDSYSGLELQPVSASFRFRVGDVDHLVLHPVERESSQRWSTNDSSLVLLVSYRHFSILFSGDIEADAEGRLVPDLGKVTVLKVAHHGSRTSSSRAFVGALDPALAIISAGRNSRFGHPSPQVLDRFREMGVDVLSTPEVGTIRLHTDGLEWRVETFSARAGRFQAPAPRG